MAKISGKGSALGERSLLRLLQRRESVRMELENSAKTLKELAETYGFDSPFYLSARFRKQFGVPPREYRRNYLSSLARGRR